MIVNRPPLGWNSWNTFGPDIDERLIRETAEAMIDTGLRDAGYEYLVIDDCWSLHARNERDELVADPEKFPGGMRALADFVHGRGLKLGIYSCNGPLTCARYPGSFDHEFIDAKTFAEWGIDFLKYDNCNRPLNYSGRLLYKRMGLALANCGRDILFSACNWGEEESQNWIKETGAHMWRSTGDIVDNWNSVKKLIERQVSLLPTNGQGCFNDMDMLVVGMGGKGHVGMGGCTLEEYRTHFSAWAMFGSPLMIGCDIRNMSPEVLSILTNREVIAIDQDPAYRQVFAVPTLSWDPLPWRAWVRFLDGGDVAIAYFNLDESTIHPCLPLSELGLGRVSGKALRVRDLWSGEDMGVFKDYIEVNVEPHCCLMMRGSVVDA